MLCSTKELPTRGVAMRAKPPTRGVAMKAKPPDFLLLLIFNALSEAFTPLLSPSNIAQLFLFHDMGAHPLPSTSTLFFCQCLLWHSFDMLVTPQCISLQPVHYSIILSLNCFDYFKYISSFHTIHSILFQILPSIFSSLLILF